MSNNQTFLPFITNPENWNSNTDQVNKKSQLELIKPQKTQDQIPSKKIKLKDAIKENFNKLKDNLNINQIINTELINIEEHKKQSHKTSII